MSLRASRKRSSEPARCLLAILLVGVSGCAAPAPRPDFRSTDSRSRIRAIQEAVAADDRTKVSELIQRLESDDPAERLLSIRGLERMTGQTLGYDHVAPRAQRNSAVARWADWYAASRPGSAPSSGVATRVGPNGTVSTERR